jgi:hypothetical protein
MVPHFPTLGSGGVPPMPPTILMTALKKLFLFVMVGNTYYEIIYWFEEKIGIGYTHIGPTLITSEMSNEIFKCDWFL